MVLFAIFTWLAIMALAWRTERQTSTRRHVRLAVEVFTEELRRIQVQKLSTPGGAAGSQRASSKIQGD